MNRPEEKRFTGNSGVCYSHVARNNSRGATDKIRIEVKRKRRAFYLKRSITTKSEKKSNNNNRMLKA